MAIRARGWRDSHKWLKVLESEAGSLAAVIVLAPSPLPGYASEGVQQIQKTMDGRQKPFCSENKVD